MGQDMIWRRRSILTASQGLVLSALLMFGLAHLTWTGPEDETFVVRRIDDPVQTLGTVEDRQSRSRVRRGAIYALLLSYRDPQGEPHQAWAGVSGAVYHRTRQGQTLTIRHSRAEPWRIAAAEPGMPPPPLDRTGQAVMMALAGLALMLAWAGLTRWERRERLRRAARFFP